MTQDEGQLSESNNAINFNNELPARKTGITVEFSIFIAMMAVALSGAAMSNIILYRTCVHSLNHSPKECSVFLSLDKNNNTEELEKEVQKYTTFVSTVRSVLESVAPAILSMFLGVWSDTHGRKPLVVWPMLGMALTGILMVVYSIMDNLGPWWYIITVIPLSLSGGFTVMFTGVYCYLSDVTSSETRSLRMTVLEASVSVGIVIGSVASSYILRLVGNVYLLLISATLSVIGYAYTNICLRESLSGAISGSISSVLDLLLVKEMLRECFKRRPNRGRTQILLLTFANCISIFILYGVMNLEYFYSRTKLHWNMKDYTLFSATSTMVSFAGAFLGVGLIQKFLRVSDLAFINVAFLSSIAEFIIKALAVYTWHMYLGTALAMFRGLSAPLIRSLITKILPVQDIAKVFALMSAIEGLCPLVAPVMFNSLYESTLTWFPASIYVLSVGFAATSLAMVAYVQYLRWNVSSPYERLQEANI